MLQSQSGQALAMGGKVLKATVTPNREDRPRFSRMVVYKRYHDAELQIDWVQPLGLTGRWTRQGVFVDFTEKELPWRVIRPGRAPRELEEQWKAHVKEQAAKEQAIMATAREAARRGL